MAETCKTDGAADAFFNVVGQALKDGMPAITRNEPLDRMLDNIGDGDGAAVNVSDGETTNESVVGADEAGVTDGYELEHRMSVEVVVVSKNAEVRRKTIVAILNKMHVAIAADRTLGQFVNDARIEKVEYTNLVVEGLPPIRGVTVSVVLMLLSDRPF